MTTNRFALRKLLLFAGLCLAAMPLPADASARALTDRPLRLAQAADSGANALRDVEQKMTVPDPDARIANLDTFLAEGNGRKIERAIKIAAVDTDENVRAAAFRAYIASTRSIQFDVLLSPAEQSEIDANRERRVRRLPNYLHGIAQSTSVTLIFEPAPMASNRGIVQTGSRRQGVDYVMRGERLTFTGGSTFGNPTNPCNWELRLVKDRKIAAVANCRGFERPVQMLTTMY